MATTPKDAHELFDVQVPEALSQHPDKAREVDAIFFFDITGDDGGQWTVDLKSDPPTCAKGDAGNSQCAIKVSHDDFKEILKDPNKGMNLFFEGKLQVSGDVTQATKLQQFLSTVGGASE